VLNGTFDRFCPDGKILSSIPPMFAWGFAAASLSFVNADESGFEAEVTEVAYLFPTIAAAVAADFAGSIIGIEFACVDVELVASFDLVGFFAFAMFILLSESFDGTV
jgi:hypothetical protein